MPTRDGDFQRIGVRHYIGHGQTQIRFRGCILVKPRLSGQKTPHR